MTLYRYQSGSLLDSAQVLTNEAGGMRAYLFAAGDAPSNELRAKKQAIRELGWKCVPIVHDGKPALEVRGFKDKNELTAELHRLGITGSVTSITPDEGDKRSRKEKLSNATLKLAGISYNVGDASYLFYAAGPLIEGWKSKNKTSRFFGIVDVAAGIGYGVGSLCLTFFGSKDQSINVITAATRKVEEYARKESLKITPESSIAFANQEPKRSLWGKIAHTISRYPSEALNSIYVFVGLFVSSASLYRATRPVTKVVLESEKLELGAAAALKKAEERFAADKKAIFWDKIDVGLGVVTTASALTGLFVKEHKRLEGDPKRGGVGGIIDWIREKPLRATGLGYMVATGFHAVATWGKWKDKSEAKKYLIGRVIFIAANIFSEAMLMFSSKGHGVGVKPDDSVDKSVIGATAELILRQPPEKREALIENMAGYMASREVLGLKAETIAAELRTHINLLDNNPWTKHYVPDQHGEMREVEANATAKQIEQAHVVHNDKPGHTIHQAEYVAKHQPALVQGVSA